MKAYISDLFEGKKEVDILCLLKERGEWLMVHEFNDFLRVSHYNTGYGVRIKGRHAIDFKKDCSLSDIVKTVSGELNKIPEDKFKKAINNAPVINKPLG